MFSTTMENLLLIKPGKKICFTRRGFNKKKCFFFIFVKDPGIEKRTNPQENTITKCTICLTTTAAKT